MMIENWIQLFHIPEFYEIAFTLFNNISINNDQCVTKFGSGGKLVIQSPLGITSNYNHLIRVRESLAVLGKLYDVPPETLNMLPSHLYMRGAKRTERKDGSLYYGFGSIIFLWVQEEQTEFFTPQLEFRSIFNDYNFPCIVEAKHIGINFSPSGNPDHGQPQNRFTNSEKWRSAPALKASYVCACWGNEDGRQTRANGPNIIGFRNYREFWLDGKFKRAKWDGNGFDWPLGWMREGTTEKEIDQFVKLSKGTRPRDNQFFVDERDEFNYMTEFMISG